MGTFYVAFSFLFCYGVSRLLVLSLSFLVDGFPGGRNRIVGGGACMPVGLDPVYNCVREG